MPCIEEWLRDITDVFHEIHLQEKTDAVNLSIFRIQLVKLSIWHTPSSIVSSLQDSREAVPDTVKLLQNITVMLPHENKQHLYCRYIMNNHSNVLNVLSEPITI